MDVAQFGLRDDLGYRRPPATVSYDDLRRRGLPEVLLVHSWLPEGVTVCDIDVSANAEIRRLLIAPQADGRRVCTLDLVNGNGGDWLTDNHPVTFTIATRPAPGGPARGALAGGPA
jgi:hypothetical protein